MSSEPEDAWLLATPDGPVTVKPGASLTIGRGPENDLSLGDQRASWEHARIEARPGECLVVDLGSSNGTFVDGIRVDSQPASVGAESVIRIGFSNIVVVGGPNSGGATPSDAQDGSDGHRIVLDADDLAGPASPVTAVGFQAPPSRTSELAGGAQLVPLAGTISIGRDPSNDIVLDEPNVSRRHARVVTAADGSIQVEDLGSRNGTRLRGEQVRRASLVEGDEIGIGPALLRVERGALAVIDSRQELRLEALDLSMRVGEKTILQPTSLDFDRGQLVALIGQSGSGKSTLVKMLAGVTRPSSGEALLSGEPIALRRAEIGYVPQAETVHEALTVDEALYYATRIRLPPDISAAEAEELSERILRELELTEHRSTRVANLSGGQRKRVACAVELIGRASVLLLDEPTSGLDPDLERRLMETFRNLADQGRAVVVVTHATRSLRLCDRVVVMGAGGVVLFSGSPDAALEYFGVGDFDEIYASLDTVPAQAQRSSFYRPRRVAQRTGDRPRSFGRQYEAVTARYAKTLVRDRRTLISNLAQVLVIGALLAVIYPADLFSDSNPEAGKAVQFIFLMVTGSLWFGLTDSCRELVKERPIIERERVAGLRIGVYLAAKLTVLFALVFVQVVLFALVVLPFISLDAAASAYLLFMGVLLAVALCAVAMGLLASALASSVDQVSSILPLILLPQLLLAGTLVSISSMPVPGKLLSNVIAERWGVASAGSAVDIQAKLEANALCLKKQAAAGDCEPISQYGDSFFELPPTGGIFILLGLSAIFLTLTVLRLQSQGDD